jgi:thiosulfate/3-mercaptopyruvate sulfurtransferase
MFPKKVFVKPTDVAPVLSKMKVVDCRYVLGNPSHGRTEFQKSRLPGAVYADVDTDLSHITSASTARHPLPAADKFIGWCQAKVIGTSDPAVPVLCYDDTSGAHGGCRLWWMLDQLRLEAYVLDGGFQGYVAAGFPVDTATPSEEAAPYGITKQANLSEWKWSTDWRSRVKLTEIPLSAHIVDARTADRFGSTVRPLALDTLPGHVPGAVNHPHVTNVTPHASGAFNILKDDETLRKQMLTSLQGHSMDQTVLMCASGVTTCFNAAVIRHSGIDGYGENLPRVYDGSWSEYAGSGSGFASRRTILSQYGVLFVPVKANPAGAALTEGDLVSVDGKDSVPASAVQPVDLKENLLKYLKVSETMKVYFADGREYTVTSTPKPA